VLTCDFGWFTDTQQPQLYGVPLGPSGTAGEDFLTLQLMGDWVQTPGPTRMHCADSKGRRCSYQYRVRIALQSGSRDRYRDPGRSGGYELTNGDGRSVRGTTFYVVQTRLKQVAVFKINADGASGELVDILGSNDFDVPTTVTAFGNSPVSAGRPLRHSGPGNGRVLDYTHRPPLHLGLVVRLLLLNGPVADRLKKTVREGQRGSHANRPP
jgi:hypothetical protein